MAVNNVCGCMDLRTGAMFIAITQMVIGLICIASWKYALYWSIISGLLVAIAGGCLLFSVIAKNVVGSMLYLIFTLIGIIIVAVTGVMMIIWEGDDWHGVEIVVILLYFAWMAVLIYFWICGYSFYSRFRN